MTTNTNFVNARVHRLFLLLVFALGMNSLSGPSLAGVGCEYWPDISYTEATVTDVERCLIAGANVNARMEHGFTPLHKAIRWGANPAVVQVLIDTGADVHARLENSATPLHYARSRDVVQALITAGADVNAQDKDGETPLDLAVDKDADPAVVQALIDAGANIKAR